ncbi:MAG: hypothetical protein ABIL05_01030 [candidate division WOR-3 bacterium]
MKKAIVGLLLFVCLVPVWAKDLSGRIGVGSEIMLTPIAPLPGVPLIGSLSYNALSVRTYLDPKVGLSGNFVMTLDGETTLGIGTGILYNIVSESNLNLLTKVGFNFAFVEDIETFRIPVLLNAEFFLNQINNLGIEMGVGLMHFDIIEGDLYFYLGTSSLAPNLGFHYYF